MNKEMFVSPSLIAFEDFAELMDVVDECIDIHSSSIAKYEDKLGVLLRGAGGESKAGLNFSQETPLPSSEGGGAQENQGKNEKRKKQQSSASDGSELGWLVLESEETSVKVATGNIASTTGKQVEALFKIIESLKAKLASLERARKLIADLPAQGFKPNQSIVVMFRDGIPRQIIPSYDAKRTTKKFQYSEQFDIQVFA